ncbi:glycosyltransferase [Alteromonas pelagimontana]|uniref:Glycosyltransferase n=1 Tax=Alteromonas pelagimontana TaxID=1858656 RepID=A0A6M4MC18_9ALTE|nr:glycosyltransferase [Alteromonas pelagimontana]QJR80589.1 glycosyltransferase [Alteromonas pelagimontana]
MKLNIAFFGSSLVSSYWNGAATYYRGIIRALAERGHTVTFYEPDAFDRQKHRDMEDPSWARVRVYQPTEEAALAQLKEAAKADIVVKASGVGVLDEWLEQAVLEYCGDSTTIFWDVDAPATLARVKENANDPFRELIPEYDMVLTYGGGNPVIDEYTKLGAQYCQPIYNALDPSTHHPVEPDSRFSSALLGFLGNRLPDREARVKEFFFKPAQQLHDKQFLLGGSGWEDVAQTIPNLDYAGHIYTRDHNAFNCSPLAVLNINRDSMAATGFSPPTRVFEAAGAAACLIMDYWQGVEQFLEPDTEVLVARNGDEVTAHLQNLSVERAKSIGQAARARVLAEHTYSHRAEQFEQIMKAERTSRAYV